MPGEWWRHFEIVFLLLQNLALYLLKFPLLVLRLPAKVLSDTQVHLALRSSDIQNGLTLLDDCTATVMQWYLVHGLLLNANKSEAICLGTSSQIRAATDTFTIAGTTLLVSEEIRSLGPIIDRRLTFESHITGVVKSCNYHLRALQHIRHLLPFSTAQTLACSLILSRLD